MQVLSTGTSYKIFDSSIQTYDKLPVGVYKIKFDKMEGWSLILSDNITVEEKIYGVHEAKVQKVYDTFNKFDRNLGVILSGDKGIGKSLFAKLLAIKAVENNFPIIICDTYYPGIATFLSNINQQVVILFDEFDKTFSEIDGFDPQTEMLTLFDGLYMGKKLFVITCNKIHKLNDYLVNRPGRFHYHFRFNYPTASEIREYMQDHISKEYWDNIDAVITFSHKVDLNYDCLRSICFELDNGICFEDAIQDLNIMNIELERYDVTLYYKDGTEMRYSDVAIDTFSDESKYIELYKSNSPSVSISFIPQDARYDLTKGILLVDPQDITIDCVDRYNDYDEPGDDDRIAYLKDISNVAFLALKHRRGNSYRYTF